METRYLDFTVTAQEIAVNVAEPAPRGDTQLYLKARFTVDGAWEGLALHACFRRKGKGHFRPVFVPLDDARECDFPPELLTAPDGEGTVRIHVGLVGLAGAARLTTGCAVVRIDPSCYLPGETPAPPAPDVYAALLAACAGKLPAPEAAAVGEVILAAEVDETGRVVRTETAPMKTYDEALGAIKQMLYSPVALTLHEGYYIHNSGVIDPNPSFAYTEPVVVPAGYRVRLTGTGYAGNVAMISKYVDGACKPLVISTDGVDTYEYVTPLTMSLVFCFHLRHPYAVESCCVLDRLSAAVRAIDDRLDLPLDGVEAMEGYYINSYAGTLSAATAFACTTPMFIPAGYRIRLTAAGYLTNVTMIGRYREEGVYTPLVKSTGSNLAEYSYLVEEDGLYAVSYSIRHEHTLHVEIDVGLLRRRVVEAGRHAAPFASPALFTKIGVVGDSYASGELYFDGAYHDLYPRSWGQILARRNGASCVNFSSGGLTARSWLTADRGLPLLLATEAQELYLLALGINDAAMTEEGYLGTLDDIKADHTANGDTFYGSYGRIISEITAHAPGAKLVMMTMHERSDARRTYNAAIREIAAHFGIACIEQDEDDFFLSDFYAENMVKEHPVAVVYSGMAEAIGRLLARCMVERVDYFADVFMS